MLTPMMMTTATLTTLILVLGVVGAALTFWVLTKPMDPEAVLVANLSTLLDRIEASGGKAGDDDRAELQRLLDYAHGLKLEAGIVHKGDALLHGG